jgi:hypothetical protein
MSLDWLLINVNSKNCKKTFHGAQRSLKKALVAQQAKKLPAIHEYRSYTNVFIRIEYWSLL